MMDTFRTAAVYVRDTFAGELKETDEGYLFAYDKDYLAGENPQAVSLTLPLQEEPYRSKTLFPFFDGLIPEGWLLNVVSRNWKIDAKDRFGLLLVACRDAIGAVRIEGEHV
jgi:serine/threonine-protein kinase HipA